MSEDREAWQPVVEAMLSQPFSGPEDARGTIGMLASLLRSDRLPKAGRAFLADYLEGVASGCDPRKILPRQPKRRAASRLEIMSNVERERERQSAGWGEMERVYSVVARRLDLGAGTVAKDASIGREWLREAVERNVAAGVRRDQVVAGIAQVLQLSEEAVEKLLKAARQGKSSRENTF